MPFLNSQHAFRYLLGKVRDLGDLGGGQSHAAALSDAGDVAGCSLTKGGAMHAFVQLAEEQGMIDLGTIGLYTDFRATSVNSSGVVVGTAGGLKGHKSHGFLYTPQSGMLDLNQLVAKGLKVEVYSAASIDDEGQIAVHGMVNGAEGDFILVAAAK